MVAGNRYLQCDGEGEVGVLGEDGGLTQLRWELVGSWNYLKFLKSGWNGKKMVGKQNVLKDGGGMLGKRVHALKRWVVSDPLTNYVFKVG